MSGLPPTGCVQPTHLQLRSTSNVLFFVLLAGLWVCVGRGRGIVFLIFGEAGSLALFVDLA